MYTKEQANDIHKEIREDLIDNQSDLVNRFLYYTHKHRSQDRLLDVNVGIFLNDRYQPTAQIYVATAEVQIREQFILGKNNQFIDSNIIIKELC